MTIEEIYDNTMTGFKEIFDIYDEELEEEDEKQSKIMCLILHLIIINLPNLFFSIQSKNYIKEDFYIADDQLRTKCYNYIFKILDNKDSAGQDLDSYGEFCSVIKHIDIIYTLVKQKEFEKLEKLMSLDEAFINYYHAPSPHFSFWTYTTTIDRLYNLYHYRDIESFPLNQKALSLMPINEELNYFLTASDLDNWQKSMIIYYFYNSKSSANQLTDLEKNCLQY